MLQGFALDVAREVAKGVGGAILENLTSSSVEDKAKINDSDEKQTEEE